MAQQFSNLNTFKSKFKRAPRERYIPREGGGGNLLTMMDFNMKRIIKTKDDDNDNNDDDFDEDDKESNICTIYKSKRQQLLNL